MSFDFKIYQDKELIAATVRGFHAVHVAQVIPRAVIKHAGRVVWNTTKDGPASGATSGATIQARINHNREQARAKYDALKNGAKR